MPIGLNTPPRVAALDHVAAASPGREREQRGGGGGGGDMPPTLMRRTLEVDGSPMGYKPTKAARRWGRYVDAEEARADDVVREQVRLREEKIAMMKLHYRKRGMGRYVPPPEPAWMRGEVRDGTHTSYHAVVVRLFVTV